MLFAGIGLLTACSTATHPGAKPRSPAAVSPVGQLLQSALAAARASGSVHYTQISTPHGGTPGTSIGDVALTQGRQIIRDGRGEYMTTLVVPTAAYFRGTASALRNVAGMTASQSARLAHTWIRIPAAYPTFKEVAFLVTLPTVLANVTPTGQLREKPATVAGNAAIAISGNTQGHAVHRRHRNDCPVRVEPESASAVESGLDRRRAGPLRYGRVDIPPLGRADDHPYTPRAGAAA